jgi:hypothetical protein
LKTFYGLYNILKVSKVSNFNSKCGQHLPQSLYRRRKPAARWAFNSIAVRIYDYLSVGPSIQLICTQTLFNNDLYDPGV